MSDRDLLDDVPSVTPTQAQALVERGALLIDIREVEEHAAVRIRDSELRPLSAINRWWRDLPGDRPVVLYCRTGSRSHQATSALTRRGGLTNVVNMTGGIVEWFEQGLPVDTDHIDVAAYGPPYTEMGPVEAAAAVAAGEVRRVLDVREEWEWVTGHLEGAMHIPLPQLTLRVDEIPRAEAVLVVCHTGQRSALAAQYLADAGFADVRNLEGGLEAWSYHGLAVVRD